MALGFNDANGIWINGEDDTYATFSARLNKSISSISAAFTSLKNRVQVLEARVAPKFEAMGRVTVAGNATGTLTINFPAGRFTVPPIVNVQITVVAANSVAVVTAVTKDQMTVKTFLTSTGAALVGVSFDWTARQMTATAAEG